jgi:TetR/AcrR family transcriptional regulator, tetracycline repressor protein
VPSPPRLTRDALVDAGVALADREGLDAVSIRRLAGEAGVTPMALYWHVKDKDELLAALRDRLLSEVELPRPRAASAWARELRELLEALLAVLVRHPALAPLALTGLFESEPGLVLAERVYGLMEAAGFSDGESAHQGAFLLGSVVALVTAWPGGDAHAGRAMPEVPADAFPLAARLAPTVGAKDPAEMHARGLDVLVAGLKGLAPRR